MAGRRRSFPRARRVLKKNYSWRSGVATQVVRSSTGQTAANAIALLPGLDTGLEPGLRATKMVERVLIQGSIKRATSAVVDALRYNISRVQVDSAQVPIQIHDPADGDAVRLAAMNILRRGHLDVPPFLINGFTGALAASEETKCFEVDFRPRFTIRQSSEELNLRFGVGSFTGDLAIEIRVNFYILISF